MKVFISWSGDTSRQVATALRDWLPNVIQAVEPYVSSEDIDKGTRWQSEIASELAQCDFGLVCIDATNSTAPWINFEAGALSKSLETARVVPLLFRMKKSDLTQGPLVQFQSAQVDKTDLERVVRSVNRALGDRALAEERIGQVFRTWWPHLEEAFGRIEETAHADAPARADSELLEELLELARAQQRSLASPEALLPPSYLTEVLGPVVRRRQYATADVHPDALRDIVFGWSIVEGWLETAGTPEEITPAIEDITRAVRHIERRVSLGPSRRDLQMRSRRLEKGEKPSLEEE